MRRAFVISIAVCASACANAETPSSAPVDAQVVDSGGTDATSDSARDTHLDDLGSSDGIFPTDDTRPAEDTTPAPDTSPGVDTAPPPICALPSGTSATASGAYSSTPTDAIDGSLGTVWNSGGYSGWLQIQFPSPVTFDRVRFAGNSLPDCSETFTVSATLGGGTPTTLMTQSFSVTGSNVWYPTVDVPRGTYDAIHVDVGTSASWIAVAEVLVYDSASGCTEP